MLRSLTSMSFQYARNAKPESFLTNWLHWLSDMFVTVRIGKIFWLMSLRKQSFLWFAVWLCESCGRWSVMGGSAGPAKKGSSEQMSEAQKQATDQKWGNCKTRWKSLILLKKRCSYDQVVMQQDSTLSTTSIVFWWILFTLCTEISSQIVVEWIIVQLIWLFVVIILWNDIFTSTRTD